LIIQWFCSWRLNAVADFRHDAFETELAGVGEHLVPVDLEAFAELDVGTGDDLLQGSLPLDERQLPKVVWRGERQHQWPWPLRMP